jgi:flagellar brake protein
MDTAVAAQPAQTIASAAEIVHLLQQVRQSDNPVTIDGPQGLTMTCRLWDVDDKASRLVFSADENQASLQGLLESGTARAQSRVDGVRIDFEIHGLTLVRGTHSHSLQATLPRALHRHQRRDSYRVPLGPRGGPSVRAAHPLWTDAPQLRALDISLGGCSLLLTKTYPCPEVGDMLRAAKVDLAPGVRFTVDLLVRSVSPGVAQGDHRLGCGWPSLGGAEQRLLQRFVDDAQRRWRSPAKG